MGLARDPKFQTVYSLIVFMDKAHVTDATVPKNNSRFKHKGRLKPISGFQTTFFNDFRGRSSRYVFCVANSLRSVGYAHELLNISDDLFLHIPASVVSGFTSVRFVPPAV